MGRITLVNGRSWPTIKAALDHFKAMLAHYQDGDMVSDPEDHSDLVALLVRYDAIASDSPLKMGPGVKFFTRQKNHGHYATSGFWVHRIDGTATDFSYICAVKGQHKNKNQRFQDACRTAVAQDLQSAKERHFRQHGDAFMRVPCDVTGELLSFDDAHLDHCWITFYQIVHAFRGGKNWIIDIPEGVIEPAADRQMITVFQDQRVAQQFRTFHHRIALLRMISKTLNISMANSQRRPIIKQPVIIVEEAS